MTICRDRAKFLVFNQQQQTIQVIANVLRCHAVLRFGNQLTKIPLRDAEISWLTIADGHLWKIFCRQGLQVEAAFTRANLQTLVVQAQGNFGTVRLGT